MSYLEELFSLKNKTTVVIGGTGELCGAMALALAKAGANVVLVGRSLEKATARLEQISAAGGEGYFIAADISSRNGLQELLSEVVERSGQCDILINGAGINAPTPFLDIPEDEYDRIFDINTKAVFLACQVFGKYFLDNDISASIINIGSMSGVIPLSRVFTYSMSKAAVHNISPVSGRHRTSVSIRWFRDSSRRNKTARC